MLEMQRQAMKRAQNITNQGRQAVKNEKQFRQTPPVNYVPTEPKHTSLPLNIPKKERDENKGEMLSFPDTDRAMLLSILLLLKNEGADELLLLALLYILA